MFNMHLILLSLMAIQACIRADRGDVDPSRSLNSCESFITCSACLQRPNCAWCSKPDFAGPNGSQLPRCNQRSWYNNSVMMPVDCSGYVEDFASKVNVVKSANLTVKSRQKTAKSEQIVQLKPQRLSITTRPQEQISFDVEFSQVEDYPVDLYYVMDLSKSMEDDKNRLAELGTALSEAMQKITSNFRLGFGSFIDKTLTPFSNEAPEKKPNNFASPDESPYLFQHHVKLSSDPLQFTSQVRNATTRGNLDYPEGSLEALMQVVVCTEHVGWRNNSRRVVIFSSDASYHVAGDAKLAGITLPNDEQCHLNNLGQYTFERLQDYPSIGQISRQVAENSINVIFAVPNPVVGTYTNLKERIAGSKVGILTDDSSNIVELVREQYNKITSAVELRHKSSEFIRIRYESSCLSNGRKVETNRCEGLKTGSKVHFTVKLEVNQCVDDKDFRETFQIYPVGINEVLSIDLDVKCQCPCEQSEHGDEPRDDAQCSNAGRYQCGICNCNEGNLGLQCQCSSHNGGGNNSSSDSCKEGNTDIECNGKGYCECGKCRCSNLLDRQVWGTYCECDDINCPRSENLICSGNLRGTCECDGTCNCFPGWEGTACECPSSETSCLSETTKEICSGNGYCDCGKCVCSETQEGFYTGKFCDICPSCSAKCSEYKDCVRCLAFKTGPLAEESCAACNKRIFNITQVSEAKAESDHEVLCSFEDEDKCTFEFVYNSFIHAQIRVHKSCPPNVAGIVTGVVVSILLIGLLLLLIWKLLTTIHDRLEFSRFEKERANAKWGRDGNPIYRPPNSLFMNPTYSTME